MHRARALMILAAATILAAQSPQFEAVSIKPADPSSPAHMAQVTAGGYRGRNLRLFELVTGAWRLNRDQIVGGPPWLETAGWDVDARLPAGANPSSIPRMMQAMLADRFELASHFETRTLPIYTLTVTRLHDLGRIVGSGLSQLLRLNVRRYVLRGRVRLQSSRWRLLHAGLL